MPISSFADRISLLAMNLREAFCAAVADEHPASDMGNQPAIDYERKAGVTGVAGRYKLPDDLSYADYEKKLFQRGYLSGQYTSLKMLDSEWNKLVTLNPELEKVSENLTNIGNYRDAIRGVATGFNVDDINYYLELNDADVEHRARLNESSTRELESKTGFRMGWVASPATLDRIKEQVHDRPAIHSLPEPKYFTPASPR